MTQRSRRHHGSLADAAEQTGLSIHTRRRMIAEGRLTRRGGRRVIRLLDPGDVTTSSSRSDFRRVSRSTRSILGSSHHLRADRDGLQA